MSDTPTPRTNSAINKWVRNGSIEPVKDELVKLERELAEAKAWKEQAMVVFNSLDLQSTAALLGGGIGEDCAEVIAKRVPEVVGQLLAHEAQHVRDEADYNELEADYRGSIAKHVERVEKLEAIIDAHKAMLQKACAELPVSYYPVNTPARLAVNIAGFVRDYTENYRELEQCQEQLTAHKAALEKCEKALPEHSNSMPRFEAMDEIAKLKGPK